MGCYYWFFIGSFVFLMEDRRGGGWGAGGGPTPQRSHPQKKKEAHIPAPPEIKSQDKPLQLFSEGIRTQQQQRSRRGKGTLV